MNSKQFFKSPFVRNASVLTLGTAFAQFLPMLLYPVLGRIYTPEQFAALAAFTALITVLQVVGSCKYETAILVSDSDKDAAEVFSLAIILNIFLILVLYLIFIIFGVKFTFQYSSGLKELIWLAPIGCLFLNVYNCYNEWCVRKKYFKKLSLNKITYSTSVTLGKYLTYYTPMQSIGLTLGDFFGRLLTAIICAIRIIKLDVESFRQVSLKGILKQGRLYIRFPLYSMPAQLLNTVSSAAPIFILNYFYSQETVGYFSMTMTVLLLPIKVISYAVRDVFRNKANDLYKKTGRFDAFFKKIFIIIFAITTVICVIFGPFLPTIFTFVLGKQWYMSGIFSQILLPMIGLDFVAMSLSGVFIVTQKLRALFIWQISYFIMTIGTLYLTPYFGANIENTLIVFCAGRFIIYLYQIISSYIYSKGNGVHCK